MNPSIAEFFIQELEEWRDSIQYYLGEIDELEEQLQVLLQLNTVPGLAARVEQYLNDLHATRLNFLARNRSLEGMESKLFRQQVPVENEWVTADVKRQHQEMRTGIHKLILEYLGLKLPIREFLADTLDKQNKKKPNHP